MMAIEITIPSKPEYVAVVRLALASLARDLEMDEETVDEMKIAVSEACANAVVASREAGTDAPIVVNWESDESSIVVEIGDSAGGSPPSLPLDDSQGFSTRRAMSEALLRSLVTKLEVLPQASGSLTRLTLAR
jgi:serine/threonine-protein kinase RsbW